MEEEVEIRITMEKADAEMLINLAGVESRVSQYLDSCDLTTANMLR